MTHATKARMIRIRSIVKEHSRGCSNAGPHALFDKTSDAVECDECTEAALDAIQRVFEEGVDLRPVPDRDRVLPQ